MNTHATRELLDLSLYASVSFISSSRLLIPSRTSYFYCFYVLFSSCIKQEVLGENVLPTFLIFDADNIEKLRDTQLGGIILLTKIRKGDVETAT
jgi:hypothetical protein